MRVHDLQIVDRQKFARVEHAHDETEILNDQLSQRVQTERPGRIELEVTLVRAIVAIVLVDDVHFIDRLSNEQIVIVGAERIRREIECEQISALQPMLTAEMTVYVERSTMIRCPERWRLRSTYAIETCCSLRSSRPSRSRRRARAALPSRSRSDAFAHGHKQLRFQSTSIVARSFQSSDNSPVKSRSSSALSSHFALFFLLLLRLSLSSSTCYV